MGNMEPKIESLLKKSHSLRSKIDQNIHDQYVENLYIKAAEISNETVQKIQFDISKMKKSTKF